jgi:hypothetical protein
MGAALDIGDSPYAQERDDRFIVHPRRLSLRFRKFEADHSGPFAGRAATGSAVKLPGCGVYEFDPAKRQITAARIYFDITTLLKQISSHQPQVLRDPLISWFASRACSNEKASMSAGGYLNSVSGRM